MPVVCHLQVKVSAWPCGKTAHNYSCCACRGTATGLAGASSAGNLTFSCDFEGGNIGFARAADNGLEYDINVRQDSHGPKHRLWFHFQMRGGAQGGLTSASVCQQWALVWASIGSGVAADTANGTCQGIGLLPCSLGQCPCMSCPALSTLSKASGTSVTYFCQQEQCDHHTAALLCMSGVLSPPEATKRCGTCNAGQKVVLNFVNFSKARALYRHGMTPLVRSSSQPQWARLPPNNCFYYKSPRHRTSNVLSVLFTVDRSAVSKPFCYRLHLIWYN